jgi:putative membrane protein
MVKRHASIFAAALAVLALAPTAALAQRYGYGPGMMWSGNGGYGMFLGPLFLILILVAGFAAVILLVRWIGPSSQGQIHHHHLSPPPKMPLDILKERFARGEIDKDEFELRRKILGD